MEPDGIAASPEAGRGSDGNAGLASGSTSPHEHEWAPVPAVVVTIGDPLAEIGWTTFNAVCATPGCGEQAWLHGDFGRRLPAAARILRRS